MNIEDFVFGSFCFIKSKSGNIIGEFLNNKNSKIFTESADLTKVIENSKEFTGEYITNWEENNVAIVMLTSLIGLLLFKEKLTLKNWLGIGLAIVAILLVTLA